jgi:peptide deformylase
MKTYEIQKDGSEFLSQKCQPMNNFKTANLRSIVERMFATMEKFNGIGLAANQVGLLGRVIVINTREMKDENKKPIPGGQRLVMINPVVLSSSETAEADDEGCLSFPGVRLAVKRSTYIRVAWQNLDGHQIEGNFTGITARCILHEVDHLDGITFRQRV